MDKFESALMGFVIGVVFVWVVFAIYLEIKDLPTFEGEWENIGEELCNLKFNSSFVDWEDGKLICEKTNENTWDVLGGFE